MHADSCFGKFGSAKCLLLRLVCVCVCVFVGSNVSARVPTMFRQLWLGQSRTVWRSTYSRARVFVLPFDSDYIYIYIYTYLYICSPPPRSTFLAKFYCKLQGIMKHTLFTTLFAMVFNIVVLLQWSTTCHNKPRKLHEFGGAKDTGDRAWDLLHQRADPHQLSYTCNFPLVLFLFPPLSNRKVFY